jgi:hypothetical protein
MELTMKPLRIISLAITSLLLAGCADGPVEPLPIDMESYQSSTAGPTEVAGTFDARVDFSTLTLTPRGKNCRLVVSGTLVFSGDIEGSAPGTTSALVFGPCSQVAVTPPGTFRDVFTSRLHFVGTVHGQPAEADVLYQGGVQVGGAIEGRLHFSNGIAGVLDVEAVVAAGGSYEGTVVVH